MPLTIELKVALEKLVCHCFKNQKGNFGVLNNLKTREQFQ